MRGTGFFASLKTRARQLKVDIPAIFLALRKPETPLLAKLLAGVTLLYALSPIDLIPDFIPVLGYLDDLIILPALIALTIRLIPKEELARCKREAQARGEKAMPRRWYYAVPVVLIWGLLLGLLARSLFF